MDDQTFQAAFESCSLTRDDWDHRAHVRMAWLYLKQHGLEEAMRQMKDGIFRYDEGTDQICNYHETLTRFWMVRVSKGFPGGSDEESFEAFVARNPSLNDKRLVLQYYSQPRVISDEARDGWVEPDLKSLDEAPVVQKRTVVDLS